MILSYENILNNKSSIIENISYPYDMYFDEDYTSLYEVTQKNKDKVPIYIVICYTARGSSKLIRALTRSVYTHAALSLDNTLNKLYSFNLNKTTNGFSVESIKDYLNDNKDAIMAVFTIFVSKFQKKKLKDILDKYVKNIEKTKYSFLNLVSLGLHIPLQLDNKMICSQFVDRMFKLIDIDITGKKSSFVIPKDFYKNTLNKLFKVFEGRIDKYKPNKTHNIVKKLAKSVDNKEIEPIEENGFIFIENDLLYLEE